jgi:hypothetical protein
VLLAMFVITPAPTFEGTARLTVPGGTDTAVLPLVFKALGRKALAEWIGKPVRLRDSGETLTDVEYLAEVVVGWPEDQVQGADGAPVPFSAEALAAVLDAYPAASQEIFDAYIQALTTARAKN